MKAFITGLAGDRVGEDERRFLRAARPAGLILFSRNCRSADQIRRLIAEFKAAVGETRVLVLIDQEGGRVQRLRPPLARAMPPAAALGALYAADPAATCRAAFLLSRLVAEELRSLDINTSAAPVLDVRCAGTHDVIGDRSYGERADVVAVLGREVAAGLTAGGVLPVMKHIPGHGRAGADSHLELPVVTAGREELEAVDFAPFRALASLPAAMTAHVVYTAVDPSTPASTSARVTSEVIRGSIGFDGLLMSDDLSMRALTGSLRSRAQAVIAAGSDLALHCNGELAEMEEVAGAVPELAGRPLQRLEQALETIGESQAFELAEAEAALERVLAGVG
jgi:beta-N-acetylhexosaminidase